MHTRFVENFYTAYHGTVSDHSYTAYVYEGAKEYNSLKKLCEEALPKLVANQSVAVKERQNEMDDVHTKHAEDTAEWNAKSAWYKMWHSAPYLIYPCDNWNVNRMQRKVEEAQTLNDLIQKSSNHPEFFLFEDKDNRVVEALLETSE